MPRLARLKAWNAVAVPSVKGGPQPRRRVERPIERGIRGERQTQGCDVRIGLPLLLGNLGAFIGDGVSSFGGSRRHDSGEGGWVVGIGCNVVDRWHGLPQPVVMP